MNDTHDPLRPHKHEPNYEIPAGDGTFTLEIYGRPSVMVTPADLATLPKTEIRDCYIVSTGHGTSGPFRFAGVRLWDLLRAYLPTDLLWNDVEVLSGDGFGNRLSRAEVESRDTPRPPLLAYERDGRPLSRQDGLVRLIVPSETDDALRQVKWVARVRVVC